MLAEAMMTFGWGLDQVLDMPARAFFSLNKAAREIQAEKDNLFFMELCDIAVCSTGSEKYHEQLKNVYWNRVFPQAKEIPSRNFVDLTNPDQAKLALAKLLGGF